MSIRQVRMEDTLELAEIVDDGMGEPEEDTETVVIDCFRIDVNDDNEVVSVTERSPDETVYTLGDTIGDYVVKSSNGIIDPEYTVAS